MTKFNQLTNLTTSRKRKRKGRGIAAGQGKTAGRGTKGQNSRTGGGVRPYFEGGQMPLIRKLPKLAGFRSHKTKASVIYTGQLDTIKTNSKVIDNYVLAQAGLVKDAYKKVKLIQGGDIKAAHSLQVQAVSKSAEKDLIAAGGSFEKVKILQRPASKEKQSRHNKKQAETEKAGK